MVVTRLNPSINGPLHLGHIYMAMVNEAFAKEHGGHFVVRWDDTHPFRIRSMGKERTAKILQGQRYDMDWLEFEPHEYIKQSDLIEEVSDILRASGIRIQELRATNVTVPMLTGSYVPLYPLCAMITAEKVIMDYMAGVTHLIRGVDLLSEFGLYQYFCEHFGMPWPKHIYLPRLRWHGGDMSKTMGSKTVAEVRGNGYTPQEARNMVAGACLRHTDHGWALGNLKETPCL